MPIHTREGLALISKDTLASDAAAWAAKARGLTITDKGGYLGASHLLRGIKALRSEVQAWFEPHIGAAMETKRTAEAARKALADEQDRTEAPLVEAESIIKRALLMWDTTQERLRRDEERRLQEGAQREAEAITLAAAAAMELEAVVAGDEEMRREAQDLFTQPIEAPVVFVGKLMPKVQGVSYRDQWKAHPTIDIKALAAAVAAGVAPTGFVAPNMPALNQFARATKGLEPVPGVRFWNDRQIAAKA